MIKAKVGRGTIEAIITAIPEEWLEEEGQTLAPAQKRTAYVEFLNSRLEKLDLLAKEAADAK